MDFNREIFLKGIRANPTFLDATVAMVIVPEVARLMADETAQRLYRQLAGQ